MDEFTAKQLELDLGDIPEKPIYVKLTPGTDLFNKVATVSNHLKVSPTKAARLLMAGGWASYVKTNLMDMKRKWL
ncbi:MAG: hypothetical protein V3S69_08025 [Dehalococcoidales bacterium]